MSSDSIGNLVAMVTATADRFASDMKQVEATLDEIKVHAKNAGEGVKHAFEIGAAVETLRTGVELAKQAVEGFFRLFDEAEGLHRMSEEVGVTASQLDELHFAAMQVGVSADEMDQTLGKLTQKIGEARAGSKETAIAFQALGLDINKLGRESTGQALREVA